MSTCTIHVCLPQATVDSGKFKASITLYRQKKDKLKPKVATLTHFRGIEWRATLKKRPSQPFWIVVSWNEETDSGESFAHLCEPLSGNNDHFYLMGWQANSNKVDTTKKSYFKMLKTALLGSSTSAASAYEEGAVKLPTKLNTAVIQGLMFPLSNDDAALIACLPETLQPLLRASKPKYTHECEVVMSLERTINSTDFPATYHQIQNPSGATVRLSAAFVDNVLIFTQINVTDAP
jgi:hypothetical protein